MTRQTVAFAQVACAASLALVVCALWCSGAAADDAKSFGTGFVVDARGYILTNEHVVHRAKQVEIIVGARERIPATILSTDPDHDLALLKANTDHPLVRVPLGASAEVKRQEPVLVIGFPFAEENVTSTSGRIVSIRKEGADQVFVTDAVVNPGNSGGPVLNERGEAIGVIRSLLLAEIDGARVKAGEIYAIPLSFAFPMLAAIPDFDWQSIGAAQARMDTRDIDAAVTPGVVQIESDSVTPGTIEGAAGEGVSDFAQNALALLTSYFERMEIDHEVDTEREFPMIRTEITMENATHHIFVVVDAKRQLVYLFLNRYIVAPENHPNLQAILRALMEYNWRLNVGKFEWDKTDGEVRYSFVFTTENGVGFEAFEAIYNALAKTGDDLWPELSKLAELPDNNQEGNQ